MRLNQMILADDVSREFVSCDHDRFIGAQMSEITILIVNWNTRELLRKALLSIGATKGEIHPEIMVIDNRSNDGSAEMVRAEFPSVHLIQNQNNLGFAKAVNKGLKQTESKAVMLLNSDAELFPGALERLYHVLSSDPKIGIVGAQLINEDGTLQNSVDRFPSLMTEIFNKSVLKILFPNWYPGKRTSFTQPTEVPTLIGAAVMFRCDMINKVGLFDEDYFFFMEETDWCYRLMLKGWKRVYVPDALVQHLKGQTAKKMTWGSKIEFFRSRYLFFKKHRSCFSQCLLVVGLLVRIVLGMSKKMVSPLARSIA